MKSVDLSLNSCHIQTLLWRHNGRDCVSNHQPHDCLLNRLFRRRSKQTSKPRVTGLCAGNSPGTGEFPAQMASNAENVSIWWRHHEHFRFHHCGFVGSNIANDALAPYIARSSIAIARTMYQYVLNLSWGKITAECRISVWMNDRKCEYTFVFPQMMRTSNGYTVAVWRVWPS